MRRSTKAIRDHVVLAASLAVLSSSAVRADEVNASSNATPPAKRLHSIPEDGIADAPIQLTRAVRELLALRPNEDLIVCVAGCSPGRDRVVYAQPIEKPEVAKVDAAAPVVAAMPTDPKPASEVPAGPMSNAPEDSNNDQAANAAAGDRESDPAATAADPDVLNKSDAPADAAPEQSSEAPSDSDGQASYVPTSDGAPANEDAGDTVMPSGEDAPR